MGDQPEDALFERFRQRGEPAVLAEVFDRSAADLFRIARHLCGRTADAEDVVQQTFLAAIERAASWDPARGLFPWLVGILTNQARLLRRADARALDPARLPQREVEEPREVAERAELDAAITLAVDALGATYRPVLHLHLYHGLNAKEIGVALGRPAGSVRTQLVRGLEQLRRALPVGLCVSAAATVGAGRGLAAVRQTVLQAAEGAAVAAGPAAGFGTAFGGVLAMKKLFGAIAMVLLMAWVWWSGMAPVPRDATDAGTGPAAAQPPSLALQDSGSPAPPQTIATRAPVRTGRRLVTVDATGSAVAGAAIHRAPTSERLHDPARLSLLGLTDAAGELTIPPEVSGGVVLASRAGFQPAEADLPAGESGTITLTLKEAATLEVVCRTRAGSPVVGARILISTGTVDLETLGDAIDCGRPGGNPLTALHMAITDHEGRAILHGLPPGRRSPQAWHPHFALVGGWPKKGLDLHRGTQAVALDWDPVWGAAVRIRTDRVLGWGIDHPQELHQPGSATTCLRVREARFTGGASNVICMLGCEKYDTRAGRYAGVPPRIAANVLTARTGLVRLELELLPSERLRVQDLDLGYLAASGGDMGEVDIHLGASLANQKTAPEMFLHADARTHPAEDVTVVTGTTLKLPSGSYSISSPNYFINQALRKYTLEVVSGQRREFTVSLDAELVPVQLNLRDSAGLEQTSAGLQFESSQGRFSVSVVYALREQRFWLPPGESTITVQAPGCQKTVLKRTVPGGGQDGQPHEIRAVLERVGVD